MIAYIHPPSLLHTRWIRASWSVCRDVGDGVVGDEDDDDDGGRWYWAGLLGRGEEVEEWRGEGWKVGR